MQKSMINVLFAFIIALTLIGCANEVPKEFDLKQLTRIDVQILSDDNNDEIIIREEAKIKVFREVFADIKWEQDGKAEVAGKEDVEVTLFFTFDKDMPGRLFEYFIWFNQGDGAAIILDREKISYGTVDKENAEGLKGILLND